MDLKAEILKEHSKKQCLKIVHWVGDDPGRFDELFDLFLNGEYRVTQRASWPLSYSVIAHPQFMKNNFGKLFSNLEKPDIHNSIKRNTVRLLQNVEIPEAYEGTAMQVCFSYLQSPNEAVAVKAFSITVLGKLARKYPDIIPEVVLIIEEHLPHQTAAFRQGAKNFMEVFQLR